MSTHKDRGWMYRRTKNGYLDLDWCALVDTKFLDFAFSQEAYVKKRIVDGEAIFHIRCPCKKCKMKHYKARDDVKFDLFKNGFMRNYTTWLAHGETQNNFQKMGQSSNSNPIQNDDFDGCSPMEAGDAYPSSEENNWEEQVPNPFAKDFYDLLEDDDEPLWEGCNVTKLQAATRLLHWKSENNVTESAFNRLLPIIKEILPDGEKLVESFYETKKMLTRLGLEKRRIDACKNHCILFYGEYKYLTSCVVCNESRYKSGRIPNLVLTYLPIIPRLQRLFMSKHTAKEMTWHSYHQTESGKMVHPSDGEAWKHFDSTHPLL